MNGNIMVSFILNTKQTPLIIRYLQNIYRLKRGSLTMSPVPLLEAFALPDDVERATQNPRRCVYIIIPIHQYKHTLLYIKTCIQA